MRCISLFLLGLSYVHAQSYPSEASAILQAQAEEQRGRYQAAVQSYCYAAKRHHPGAARRLADLYRDGIGVQTDRIKAQAWARAPAKHAKCQATVCPLVEQTATDCYIQDWELKKRNGTLKAAQSYLVFERDQLTRSQIERLVMLMAPLYDLNPDLVLSIIQIESAFQIQAESSKRAVGLMQLMPLISNHYRIANPRDAIDNLRGGMAFLSHLKRQFPDQPDWVIAAYHAGETVIRAHQGIPLSYVKTRRYVRLVKSEYDNRRKAVWARRHNAVRQATYHSMNT